MRLITEDDDKDVDSDAISMDCDNDFVEPHTQLDLGPVVNVLTSQLSHKSIQTRIAVLRWVLLLHVKTPNKVSSVPQIYIPVKTSSCYNCCSTKLLLLINYFKRLWHSLLIRVKCKAAIHYS